jgi:hypothetical protein
MERILQVCRAFDQDWAEHLAAETVGARKDAVDSVVNNRNRIAHGENVGISYVRIKEYYDRVVEVIELIDVQSNA